MNDTIADDPQDWFDNPRLHDWLARQRAAFPAWARDTGQDWDFAPASVDRLERLLRSWYSTYEDIHAAAATPRVQVAAWYLGEVQVRHCGTVWKCRPREALTEWEYDTPFVTLPEPPVPEEDGKGEEDEEGYVPLCVPQDEIEALFLRGPENRLYDVFTRYEH
ncbi:hypothetical protein [Streptomyces sp. NPDC126499]|uniref:hypothetical protein n=1 Tax=Streptomyces sp. NPDC126499 TaxID=3155314 RepID=UPI00331E8CA8